MNARWNTTRGNGDRASVRALRILALAALAAAGAAATDDAIRVRFLLTTPDGGEDTFWTWVNHDTSGWAGAADLGEVSRIVAARKPAEAWLRIEVDHSAETLNNAHFAIRHSGPLEIFVNGLKRVDGPRTVVEPRVYHVSPRRPESIGRTVYALHLRHEGSGAPALEAEFRNPPWRSLDDGAVRPPPVLDVPIRDAQACAGPDGAYYMTGTTGDDEFLRPGTNAWLRNPGIQVFKSADLTNWTSLGWVWTFERDGTWNRDFGTFGGRGPARGIFAPEIHHLKGAYWLVYSVNHRTAAHTFGIGLLRAERPEGPWREMSPDRPITDGFDANLFEDDDGAVYLLKHGGHIARMKDDMTGLAEPMRPLAAANYPYVGYEGVCLFKHAGRYHLTAADWNVHADGGQSYDSMLAVSDSLHGPYGDRVCAIRFGGHNGYFQDRAGRWHATAWCYPDSDPHWQRVTILNVEPTEDGFFRRSPAP
jgi:xylan 1,4-beta-xylosidase